MSHESPERFAKALRGGIVAPVVEGLTFVDPSLLPGPGGSARRPATALAHACADARLDFAFIPSWEPWACEAVRTLAEVGAVAVWAIPGVFTPVMERVGHLAALRSTVAAPAALEPALDEAQGHAQALLEEGLRVGAGAIVVADDLAGAEGPLAAPEYLASEVFPRLAALASRAGERDVPILLHCDGAADPLYALAAGAGFAAVHGDCGGPGRSARALAAARRAGIALVGGVATADLGTPARGAAAGAEAATLAAAGNMLVADDGGVADPRQCAALFAAFGAARR